MIRSLERRQFVSPGKSSPTRFKTKEWHSAVDDEVEDDKEGDADELGTEAPSVGVAVVFPSGVSAAVLSSASEDEGIQVGMADGLLLVAAVGTYVAAREK